MDDYQLFFLSGFYVVNRNNKVCGRIFRRNHNGDQWDWFFIPCDRDGFGQEERRFVVTHLLRDHGKLLQTVREYFENKANQGDTHGKL